MQRILSLATLGVLGGLAWMFLSGGGLNQLAQPSGTAQPPAGSWNSSGTLTWPAGAPGQPPAGSAPTAATWPGAQAPAMQQASAGMTAPPADFGPTIKIASFNIQVFGQKKAADPAVMQALAAIVRQYEVVAIQEIRTQDDYFIPVFLQLVNQNGRRYEALVGPRLGNSRTTEQYAFLYDAERIACARSSAYTVGDPNNLLHREPYVATFWMNPAHVNPDFAFSFTLINVHTDPDRGVLPGELNALAEVYRVDRRAGANEDDVIMLGDFNADDAHLGRLGQIPGITPLIRGVFTNTRQNALYDNIIIHGPSTTEYAGRSGAFNLMQRLGISLADAERISDHFPVYAEFSIYERDL
ncbi:MAG TPA: endonuclease/exonuclease/phosphatase family protein, partial [Lacipirellulaceae bacterium]|nr:endonuclease/exonuclease/phosphatase family protein [Lacipirellulaceae bacterium]